MPEWLTERGIGETRVALVEAGDIIEARIKLDGARTVGSVIPARLTSAAPRNAIARDESGTEYLLPRGAQGVTEGAPLNIEIMRETIPGVEPWKRALARATDEPVREAAPFHGRQLALPAARDELADAGWNDLLDQARSGAVRFAGGELSISPTPAMTLVDVDGHLPAEELAIVGATAAAKAIRRLDIGGSIGIDLPTSGSKSARLQSAAAIDKYLPPPFERTAVNGFGFVQVVRPRVRASLIELAQDRAAFEARAMLRRAALETPGAKRLVLHPALAAALEARPEWLHELSLQVGGAVSLRADACLPMSGGYAEKA